MTLISHSTDKSAQPASETLSDAPKSSPINTTDAPLQIPTIVEPKAQGSVASRASSSSVYSGLAPSAIQEAPTASSVLLPPDPHQESQSSKQPASEGDMNSLKPTGYRQFGWRSLPFLGSKKADDKKPMLSTMVQQEKKRQVSQDRTKRFFKNNRSEKRAKESAFIVRSLIVGPSGTNPPDAKTKAISRAKVEKVKSQLLQHKSANKVIAQLRALPPSDQLIVLDTGSDGQKITTAPSSPIHAVCLPYTEVEADERHFSHLKQESNDVQVTTTSERSVTVAEAAKMVTGVANASVAQLTALFEEMQIVSLISSPDFGLTQPGDGPGILAGALPSADTVLRGIQQITPQLLALGYATGKIILPSHEGIYPPTDRMSVITYWWGFEVALPPPSLKYLASVPSVSHAVINFLTTVSLVYGGVREILPFIRYISNYIDTEFALIHAEDKGMGVVCAATWIMPAALVPRPWDFPTPPEKLNLSSPAVREPEEEPAEGEEEDEFSEVPSPAQSRPNSPPILLPPLPQHEPVSFAPNTAPPIDDTPVEITSEVDEDVPEVNVIPPTPPAAETLRGVPKEIEVVAV